MTLFDFQMTLGGQKQIGKPLTLNVKVYRVNKTWLSACNKKRHQKFF